MGNAYLWWYPRESGTIEAVDLGPSLSDLEEIPDPLIEAVESISGSQSRITYRGRYRVRVSLERINGSSTSGRLLMRSLWSLQTHLDGGGVVAFARDAAKAWAGFTFPSPARGDSTIKCVGAATGGAFPYLSSATLAAGDEVVMQASAPELHQRELLLVSSFASTSTITLDTQAVRYDWTGVPALVRHRDFYPILRQPVDRIGESILLSERRIGYTLDLHLVEDAGGIEAIRGASSGWLATSTESRGGSTLPQMLDRLKGIQRGIVASGGSKLGGR